ncbi:MULTISPECIES: TetR family transcriptional regulator [unclassified Pseudoalteromonas]|jgi:AcrR family transcriptional regulator|uniref:TetR family transcriptional regulator n=1 Tax=unclassified Pseudoalteromonas TaxID=194690 RepID=UPI0013FD4A33|nr:MULTISPECIES: TetR family transcriptional regulator [unclassified Pseudoalteromonas]MDC9566719.1 TetR family transcriptional regulator [Pseudoalteromonas sp. GAB2316C]MDC9570961.1 TetR family transcriptional regulator [Pseudoalteromonas sp. GABNB9D]MDC9575173.1 TetR family transcriptional regulator [Pseudoalteromonas sp. GABNS16A]MDC9579470.1 TetR family transcriptional regulator [Pseudoalteromonas sp. GABNS16E]MDC9587185.1 TetR family transcriptional regulator [Pseudoalteromonas sp. GABNS1
MSNQKEKATHKAVRLAIVRIEKGRPNTVSHKRKMSVAAVAEEAGVSRALIHRDCPELLERIKGGVNKDIRQQRDAKQTELNKYKDRNRDLRSEVAELKAMLAKVQSQNATLIRKNMALSNVLADNSNVTQLIYS